jgi:hypothetical protein
MEEAPAHTDYFEEDSFRPYVARIAEYLSASLPEKLGNAKNKSALVQTGITRLFL